MSDDHKNPGFLQQPRNLLLLVAGAFGLYMLVSGIIGIVTDTDDADSLLQDVPQSKAKTALLALPQPDDEKYPGYIRSEFGDGWADLDGDGCNTRNEILARDLEEVEYRNGDCVVAAGVLEDPYTGKTIDFVRGEGTSEAVQIDHVVPLANAWISGAWKWDLLTREEFANDPLNLLAVEGQANQDKAAMTADLWLPANEEYHCDYVLRQIAVKDKWKLSVGDTERVALAKVLRTCSDTNLPTN